MTKDNSLTAVLTAAESLCRHCGGLKAQRNPPGNCDHLYWPDCLTDEAKRANGFVPKQVTVWVQECPKG